jgi:hypothetical protein
MNHLCIKGWRGVSQTIAMVKQHCGQPHHCVAKPLPWEPTHGNGLGTL